MSGYVAQIVSGGGQPGHLVFTLLLISAAAVAMVAGALLVGRLFRPHAPHPEKAAPYECGEEAIGTSWVQFDLRFYVVALVFVIFEVEIVLLFPWAVVFGGGADPGASPEVLHAVRGAALVDMLFFLGVLAVGFLYLWKSGYLNWVRGRQPRDSATERAKARPEGRNPWAGSKTDSRKA